MMYRYTLLLVLTKESFTMKWIAFAILLVGIVLCAGCTSTTQSASGTSIPAATPPTTSPAVTANTVIPDVTGIWSLNATGHTKVEGFVPSLPGLWNISAQQGHGFSGRKEYLRNDGKTYYENFSGIITLTGEVYESDSAAGFGIGRLTSPDSMEIYYLEDGPDTKAYIISLTRHKT